MEVTLMKKVAEKTCNPEECMVTSHTTSTDIRDLEVIITDEVWGCWSMVGSSKIATIGDPKRKKPFMVQTVTGKSNDGRVIRTSRSFATMEEAEVYRDILEANRGVQSQSASISPKRAAKTFNSKIMDETANFYDFAEFIFAEYCKDSGKENMENHRRHLRKLRIHGYLDVPIQDLELIDGEEALVWFSTEGKKGKIPEFAERRLLTPEEYAQKKREKVGGGKVARYTERRRLSQEEFEEATRAKVGKPTSEDSVHAMRTTIQMITGRGFKYKLLNADIFAELGLPSHMKSPETKKVIDPAVWRIVMEAAKPNPMLHCWLALMWGLGTRPSEARALAYKNINLRIGNVRVHEAFKSGQSGEEGIGLTKTGVLRENVITDPEILDIVRAFKEWQTATQGKCKRLFTHPDGSLVTRHTFDNQLRNLLHNLIEAGDLDEWDWFSPNCVRHSYITQKLREGYTSSMVALIVGNSAAVIEKHYNKLTDRDVMEEMRSRAAG
jgi:integrase